MATVALVVMTVLLLVVGTLWLAQRRLIYLTDTDAPPPAEQVLPGARDVTLTTDDGLRLRAWIAPPLGADRGFVVLSAPGNAGNRAGRVGLVSALRDAGFTVLAIDYRGYGGNPGSPSEEGLARDLRAAQDLLVAEGFSPQRTIYLGESLGCAAVVALAAQRPPAGLVLRSPFVDLPAVAAVHYRWLPVRAMLWDRLPVAELIAGIDVPTVVVYGDADAIVPPEQSQEVADRAAGPVEVVRVAGADHNDPVLAEGPALIGAVVDLADRLAG